MGETRSFGDESPDSAPLSVSPEQLAPALSVAVGDCLGRYTVCARIGAGGMGEVFEGYDPDLGRRVTRPTSFTAISSRPT